MSQRAVNKKNIKNLILVVGLIFILTNLHCIACCIELNRFWEKYENFIILTKFSGKKQPDYRACTLKALVCLTSCVQLYQDIFADYSWIFTFCHMTDMWRKEAIRPILWPALCWWTKLNVKTANYCSFFIFSSMRILFVMIWPTPPL